jgi:hypothetical protein
MNSIYQNAAHILVWLGLDTNKEAVSAFGLVHELDEALSSHPIDSISRGPDLIDLERHATQNQKALHVLVDRGWVSFVLRR